jgi:hypothetical protein
MLHKKSTETIILCAIRVDLMGLSAGDDRDGGGDGHVETPRPRIVVTG